MLTTEEGQSLTGFAMLVIAVFSGVVTWLCVGWFGQQSALTAVVAVVLVELCLACFGVIAMLLAERMTVALLRSESNPRRPRTRTRIRHEPIWFRLPEPVPGQDVQPREPPAESTPATVAFPGVEESPARDDFWRPGRAA